LLIELPMTAALLALRSLLWTILLPGVVAGFVPWRYFGLSHAKVDSSDPLDFLGLACATTGVLLLAACIFEFARSGRGTLSPVDPPRHLVVRGLYRSVRNPMYLAVTLILLGEAAILHSADLVAYWACFFVVANLFVIGYEEPYLRSRFGVSYEAYTQQVGRWIPRSRSGGPRLPPSQRSGGPPEL
jgi:protein-S-isoprenylcysteine O-methyltransferase Ste14